MCDGRADDVLWEVDEAIELWLRAEMEQKSHLEWCGLEVALDLRSSARRQSLRRFRLDDHGVVDDHVQPLPGHVAPLVADGHGELADNLVPAVDQLVLERARVDRLTEAVPLVIVVDVVERA